MGEGGHTYGLVPEPDGLQSLPPSLRRCLLSKPCRKVIAGSCKGPARFPTEPDGASWCLVVVKMMLLSASFFRPRRGRKSTLMNFGNFKFYFLFLFNDDTEIRIFSVVLFSPYIVQIYNLYFYRVNMSNKYGEELGPSGVSGGIGLYRNIALPSSRHGPSSHPHLLITN